MKHYISSGDGKYISICYIINILLNLETYHMIWNDRHVILLKGNSTRFTNLSVLTGVGEEKGIKSFVAPEEAACNLINC